MILLTPYHATMADQICQTEDIRLMRLMMHILEAPINSYSKEYVAEFVVRATPDWIVGKQSLDAAVALIGDNAPPIMAHKDALAALGRWIKNNDQSVPCPLEEMLHVLKSDGTIVHAAVAKAEEEAHGKVKH